MNVENKLANQPGGFSTPIRPKKISELCAAETRMRSCESPSALKIPESPMMTRLGYGTGVGVYLMERSPKVTGEIRSPWAVKKIAKIKQTKRIYADRLAYEANILKDLCHPNIIGYRTFGTTLNSGPFLAMEKASSALSDLIEDRLTECAGDIDVTPFPSKDIETVVRHVASALVYLHDEKRMIHGDLKSPNVLIFGDFDVVKLCDFGVSRKLRSDGSIDGYYVGTEIWNPMEVVKQKRGESGATVTFKAEMYPFGLTIYEMIALKPPHLSTAEECYNNSTDKSDDNESSDCSTANSSELDDNAFEMALAKCLGTRPPLPNIEFDSSYNKILALFFCCTDINPDKRPSAKEVDVDNIFSNQQ